MPVQYREDVISIDELRNSAASPPKVLNIGSGPGKVPGWVNADKLPFEGVDIVADLDEFPWVFDDNEFDVILCNHFVEHSRDIIKTMDEMHRVAKHGGIIVIRTPYFANYESFRDPTHRWHLTWESFDYFTGRYPCLRKCENGWATSPAACWSSRIAIRKRLGQCKIFNRPSELFTALLLFPLH